MKIIKRVLTATAVVAGLCLAAPLSIAEEVIGEDCVPVAVKIVVGPDGTCAVRDFEVQNVGFQEEFYPWTNIEGSLFNCEAMGEWMTIVHTVLWPDGLIMPTSLAGEIIEGKLGDLDVNGKHCVRRPSAHLQATLPRHGSTSAVPSPPERLRCDLRNPEG